MAATATTPAFDAQARTSDRRNGPGREFGTTAHSAPTERWRSRTSTKRYDDRRLLHWGCGRESFRIPRRRGVLCSTVASAMSSFWPSMSLCCRWRNASSLAFLEEAEAKALEVEYMELVRFGFSKSPASLERMKEVIQRRHVLRQKGRGRKKKKKRKKRTPRTSSSRSTPGRARRRHRQWHAPGWFSSVLAVFPSYVGRPKLLGVIVGLDQYYSLLRARHRQWQWHVQVVAALVDDYGSGMFYWFYWWMQFALCSHRCRQARRQVVCYVVWLVLLVTILLVLCSLFVFTPKMLGILVDMDQKDSYGDVGKDCALALLGVVLGFIAGCGYGANGKDCALALLGLVLVFTGACCSSSSRSYTPCRGAEVPQVVHGSSIRLSSPHVEKTVKIPQLQLVGGAVLG